MTQPKFNDPAFLSKVRNVSDTKNSLNWRVKKKMARGGEASWPADERYLRVAWEAVPGWKEVEHGEGVDQQKHFGQLHIIAEVLGSWYDWNIEHLRRPGENTGTSSVDAKDWRDMGAKTWVDVVRMKLNSPASPTWTLYNGDWFGLYIAGYPGGSTVRSDVLPVLYVSSDGPTDPGDGGGSEPPGEPPTVLSAWEEALRLLDAADAALRAARVQLVKAAGTKSGD